MKTRIALGTRPCDLPQQETPDELQEREMPVELQRQEILPERQERETPPDQEPVKARDIIGTDERERITQSSPLPWHSICRLRLHFSGSNPKIGTGFLILGNVLLTAAHNLYNGQLAEKIEIYAGINGNFNVNFGTDVVNSSRLRVPAEFQTGDTQYDYGIIILNRNLGDGGAGVIRIQIYPQLGGLIGVVSGYPADIPNHAGSNVPDDGSTQWYCQGTITNQTDKQMFYNSDTTKGESGGPVLVRTELAPNRIEWCVVGIHAYGDDNFPPQENSATRITGDMISQIKQWLPAIFQTA